MSIIKYERITEPGDVVSWAKEHEAEPAKRTLPSGGTELTFNTDGNRDGTPLDWEDFLSRFREEGLALLIEPDDTNSHYFKLVQEDGNLQKMELGMSRSGELSKQDQNQDFRAK